MTDPGPSTEDIPLSRSAKARSAALVTVVSGDAYIDYARRMFETADRFFKPTERVELVMMDGPSGWPAATMMRYHVLSDNLPNTDFVFLIDADMRFEAEVGEEALPEGRFGLTATQHPGYVGKPRHELPYETRVESLCWVPEDAGAIYYCGGFIGGTRKAMLHLCDSVTLKIDFDLENGLTPAWHDESAVNSHLVAHPPSVTLPPSYCHPDDSSWYETWWPKRFERRIVAIDKSAEERGER